MPFLTAAHFSSPEGAEAYSLGRQPQVGNGIEIHSPEGAKADLLQERCCRPFGAFGIVVDPFPGAHAPGFMLSPLRG